MKRFFGTGIMRFSLVASLIHHCLNLIRKIKNKIQKRISRMRHQAVDEYLIAIYEAYQVGSKQKKGQLLDHAELVTKRSRKQLIRRLNQLQTPGKVCVKKVGRPLIYSREELVPHIKHLWEQMERVSPKRMRAAMKDWLPKYKDCPARYMKNKVPINTLDSKIKKPGYTQTDTVAHCGDSVMGPFISSLTVTDIFTTWTENKAMFTKRGVEVKNILVKSKDPYLLIYWPLTLTQGVSF